ncbi:MAG: hypothetical protein ACT4OF_12755 [Caulobacteraceae bacterium]
MRFLIAALAILLAPAPALAQYRPPDIAVQRAAMDRLEPFVGRWQGEGDVRFPTAAIVHHNEHAERDVDGLVLVLRGVAYSDAERAGEPVFRALGFISYNDARGTYEIHSYAMGHAVTATGEFLPTGEFRWGFAPGGPVQIRYTISFDQNTWREIGEMSFNNGATWQQTISLNLRRVQ